MTDVLSTFGENRPLPHDVVKKAKENKQAIISRVISHRSLGRYQSVNVG